VKTKKKTLAGVNRQQGIELALLVAANDLPGIIQALEGIESRRNPLSMSQRGTWAYYARRLRKWIEQDMDGQTPFSIFRENGNKKLPFYAFSTCPGIDCPGAGACLYSKDGKYGRGWCYSLKAWRYPAAFFRQLQNSLLMRNRREIVLAAFHAIPANRTVRLYVDGDFYSASALLFWMEACKERNDLSIYGYSKSWELFKDLQATGYAWPKNYVLNLSSGSKYGVLWHKTMSALEIARGDFIAVPVAAGHIKNKAYQDKANPGSKEYRREVLERTKEITTGKMFACPGNCGNCMPNKEHACGSKKMAGVTIAIGIHS
jgi:hypothetical protein